MAIIIIFKQFTPTETKYYDETSKRRVTQDPSSNTNVYIYYIEYNWVLYEPKYPQISNPNHVNWINKIELKPQSK